MIKKIAKQQTEKELGFRPLIDPNSKFKPLKQLFLGYEIEKRQILATVEEDHTKKKNAITFYHDILQNGTPIRQGYIMDIPTAQTMLNKLGITLNEFRPNTIRLRRTGTTTYTLTLKDRKESKTREAEFKLTKAQFYKYWPLTQGHRINKKRLVKVIRGFSFELDAFIDRYLLIAECEVQDEAKLDNVPVLGMDITNNKDWANKSLSK